MKKGTVISGTSLALLLILTILSSTCLASDVVRWKMPVLWAKGTDFYKINGPEFADLVDKMSDGKFIITPFGPGEIASALDYGEGVSKGTYEISCWHDGYWAGRDMGLGYLAYLPFGPLNFDDFKYWFWEEGGVELARDFYDKLNIFYLGVGGYSDLEPVFSKVPINSLEDFKGIKMRSSGVALTFFENLGVSVVALGGEQTYEALSRGVIDAAEHTPAAMMNDMGIHEVTKYVIEPIAHQPYTNIAYFVNKDAWEKLPENYKAILQSATIEIAERLKNRSRKSEFQVKEQLKAKGMEFIKYQKS